jgi:hypothetical protein
MATAMMARPIGIPRPRAIFGPIDSPFAGFEFSFVSGGVVGEGDVVDGFSVLSFVLVVEVDKVVDDDCEVDEVVEVEPLSAEMLK